jgi:hypothetical protein
VTAVSILVVALPSLLIVGSLWSLVCERSRPYRRDGISAAEQILDTDFASIERWILANESFEKDLIQVVNAEAFRMRREPNGA